MEAKPTAAKKPASKLWFATLIPLQMILLLFVAILLLSCACQDHQKVLNGILIQGVFGGGIAMVLILMTRNTFNRKEFLVALLVPTLGYGLVVLADTIQLAKILGYS